MTVREATERIAMIWPHRRVRAIVLLPDGGVEIDLEPVAPGNGLGFHAESWSYHRLDANGRTACHERCAALEARLS